MPRGLREGAGLLLLRPGPMVSSIPAAPVAGTATLAWVVRALVRLALAELPPAVGVGVVLGVPVVMAATLVTDLLLLPTLAAAAAVVIRLAATAPPVALVGPGIV